MRSFLRRYKKHIILILLLSIFVIPFLINIAFKISSPFRILVAEWEAGDALGFISASVY